MLLQEPLQATIWHCLNHYAYSDATFLAEVLFAEVSSDDTLHLLATCYYRSGLMNQAYDTLKKKGSRTAQNKFLMAKCCVDLKRYAEAEAILSQDFASSSSSNPFVPTSEEMTLEFGDSAPFAYQLLASIYSQTERINKSNECDKKSLKLNPFLWKSYEALCNKGDFVDPAKIFNVSHLENFNNCHGVNPILTLVNGQTGNNLNNLNNVINSPPLVTVTSTPNIFVTPQIPNPNLNQVTPMNVDVTPADCGTMAHDTANDNSVFSNVGSNWNNSTLNSTRMSGVGALNFTSDSSAVGDSDMPLSTQKENNSLMPPPTRKKVRNDSNGGGGTGGVNTPAPKNLLFKTNLQQHQAHNHQQQQHVSFNNESSYTPNFGMIPRTTLAKNDLVALRLDFNSPSLYILSPMGLGYDSPIVDKAPVKQKRTVMSSKENPLKPAVFNQSGNSNQNVTPAPANNQVRRSSRLFGSTQSSVKENSKTPTKKSRAQQNNHSPTRKPKTRMALSTQRTAGLAEKNEKNKSSSIVDNNSSTNKPSITEEVLKKPTTTAVATTTVLNVNLGAHALVLQKQSVDGLMQLLKQFGAAYVELSKYNCRKAIQMYESLPFNHLHTGWVHGLMGRAHFELSEYKEAKKCFKEMRNVEPNRLEFLEYYSTALWHLQEEVELSALTQDVTKINRFSSQTWCVAGNCFSHLKEHESAIKFFKRASQVDHSFAYAHTLLGHEYVMIEELEQALSCFRAAVRIDSRHYNAWYGIGLTYYKQERYQLAEYYYRKALSINPLNPILMCHVAVVQHAMQKTDKALETLNQALQYSPKNSLCKFERASIFFAAERYNEALNELNELKDLVPKESPVYFLLGKVHNKLNNTHLALMHFSWAMDLDPKGANSQIKEALDPSMNRAVQDEGEAEIGENIHQQENDDMMQTGNDDFNDLSDSFNPERGASTSQESVNETTEDSTLAIENSPRTPTSSGSISGSGSGVAHLSLSVGATETVSTSSQVNNELRRNNLAGANSTHTNSTSDIRASHHNPDSSEHETSNEEEDNSNMMISNDDSL